MWTIEFMIYRAMRRRPKKKNGNTDWSPVVKSCIACYEGTFEGKTEVLSLVSEELRGGRLYY